MKQTLITIALLFISFTLLGQNKLKESIYQLLTPLPTDSQANDTIYHQKKMNELGLVEFEYVIWAYGGRARERTFDTTYVYTTYKDTIKVSKKIIRHSHFHSIIDTTFIYFTYEKGLKISEEEIYNSLRDGRRLNRIYNTIFTYQDQKLIQKDGSYKDGSKKEVTMYEYYTNGKLKSEKLQDAPLYYENTITYDSLGNLLTRSYPSIPNFQEIYYQYDKEGRVVNYIEKRCQREALVAHFDYEKDQIRRRVYKKNPNYPTRFELDENGEEMYKVFPCEFIFFDSLIQEFQYDTLGNLVFSREIDDILGEGENNIEECYYYYDSKGRIESEETHYGNNRKEISIYLYDNNGNLIKVTKTATYNKSPKEVYETVYDYY